MKFLRWNARGDHINFLLSKLCKTVLFCFHLEEIVLHKIQVNEIETSLPRIISIERFSVLTRNNHCFRYTKPQTFADCIGNELPLGWEEAYDPQIGPYYINHVNREYHFCYISNFKILFSIFKMLFHA